MVSANKILTVSYGTFSCTLEGFDDPFSTMKSIAEYFRDLAADDRYFGAEPPQPDADMLHRIAEREIQRRVEARVGQNGVHLRQLAEETAPAAVAPAVAPAVSPAPKAAPVEDAAAPAAAAPGPEVSESVAAKLSRIRAVVARARAGAAYGEDDYAVPGAGPSIASAFADIEDAEPADEPAAGPSAEDIAAEAAAEVAAEGPSAEELSAEEMAREELAEIEVEVEAENLAESFDEPEPDAAAGPERADAGTRLADAGEPAGSDEAGTEWAEADEAAGGLADADALLLEGEEPGTFADVATEAEFEDDADAALFDESGSDELASDDAARDEGDEAGEPGTDDGAFDVPLEDEGRFAPMARIVQLRKADYDAAQATGRVEALIDGTFETEAFDDEDDAGEDEAPSAALEARARLEADEDDTVGVLRLDAAARVDEAVADEATGEETVAEAAAMEGEAVEETAGPVAEAGAEAGEEPEADRLAALVAQAARAGEDDHDAAPMPEGEDLVEEAAAAGDWTEEWAADAALAGEAPATEDGGEDARAALWLEQDDHAADEAGEAQAATDWDEDDADLRDVMAAEGDEAAWDDDLARALDAEEDESRMLLADDEIVGDDALLAAEQDEDEDAVEDEDTADLAAMDAAGEADGESGDEAGSHRHGFEEMPDSSGEESVDRILAETNTQLESSEMNRRRSAIAHLKAAVAAARAERAGKAAEDEAPTALEKFREDLARVVRPRRPQDSGQRTERRLAPLMLVSEQRVDLPPPEDAAPGQAVRPRRVSTRELLDEERGAMIQAHPAAGFADFAERMGAHDLTDVLEAAAAYSAFVEGRPHVSRPQIMKTAQEVAVEGVTREDQLRSFGMLLRQGKIQKLKRGQFTVSASTRFKPEHRHAGE